MINVNSLFFTIQVGTKSLSQNQNDLPSTNRGMWQNPNTTNIASKTYDCLAA